MRSHGLHRSRAHDARLLRDIRFYRRSCSDFGTSDNDCHAENAPRSEGRQTWTRDDLHRLRE